MVRFKNSMFKQNHRQKSNKKKHKSNVSLQENKGKKAK